MQSGTNLLLSPSTVEWALLLLALVAAALLRFWQLEQLPPGLYRDEAFNGLDALRVLEGEHALFFPANNGREPLYIYLTALTISFWGRTTLAVRLSAAVIGTLSTLPLYGLGKSWFGWRAGVLAAWVWAITLWPVHLSHLGLRVILVVPILTFSFWVGTEAFRKQRPWLWAFAGLLYGLGFYSYLAFRFTPLLLIVLLIGLILSGHGKRLFPGVLYFCAGLALTALPLALAVAHQPDLLLGRSGQVSILNPDVHGGSLSDLLLQQIGAALGMFIWRGDTILRHNLPGRPVFDPFMVIPFLIGFVCCIRRWREPAVAALLLWLAVMLGPTILAADAPHFLRAAGVLPAAVLVPAIGLACLWRWPRLPRSVGFIVVAFLLLASLLTTIRDYREFATHPGLPFAFEAAATDLARELNATSPGSTNLLDERLWTSWPSIEFLVHPDVSLVRYETTDDLPATLQPPATIFAWPYESLEFVPELLSPPLLVNTQDGPLTRGELEEHAYPLYVRYRIDPLLRENDRREAIFGEQIYLEEADVTQLDPYTLQVDLYWESNGASDDDLIAFTHVSGAQGLVGQVDRPLAGGRWPAEWWRPGIRLHDRHMIALREPFDEQWHVINIGLYRARDGQRLPVVDAGTAEPAGSSWSIRVR